MPWMWRYDGEQAQSLVDEADFDLVILDLVLPKVDGFEVLNHIQRPKAVPSCPDSCPDGQTWRTG